MFLTYLLEASSSLNDRWTGIYLYIYNNFLSFYETVKHLCILDERERLPQEPLNMWERSVKGILVSAGIGNRSKKRIAGELGVNKWCDLFPSVQVPW